MYKFEPVKELRKSLTFFIVLLATVILPVSMDNGYFNIVDAKAAVFMRVGTILAAGALVFLICTKSAHRKLSLPDIIVLAFLGIALLSTFLSASIGNCLSGETGWGVGTVTITILVIMYFYVSRCAQYASGLLKPMYAVNALLLVLGILHAAQVDVFGLHEYVAEIDKYSYLSLYGSKNQTTIILILFFSLTFGIYLTAKSLRLCGWLLAFLFLNLMGIVVATSDSAFAALGVMLAFALPYICGESQRIRRVFPVIGAYGLSLLLVSLLPCFSTWLSHMEGVSGTLTNPVIGAVLIFIGGAGYAFFCIKHVMVPAKIRRIICIILEAGIILAAAVFLIKTVGEYSDSWGTNRGLIWNGSIKIFTERFTPKEKLIGIGPEMLSSVYDEITASMWMRVNAAHSDFLQVLLSFGIVGALIWTAFWAAIIVPYFKNRIYRSGRIVLFLPLISFLVQGFFNTSAVMPLAFFVVSLGFYYNESAERILQSL